VFEFSSQQLQGSIAREEMYLMSSRFELFPESESSGGVSQTEFAATVQQSHNHTSASGILVIISGARKEKKKHFSRYMVFLFQNLSAGQQSQ